MQKENLYLGLIKWEWAALPDQVSQEKFLKFALGASSNMHGQNECSDHEELLMPFSLITQPGRNTVSCPFSCVLSFQMLH